MRTNDVPYTTLVTTVQPVAQGRPGEIGQIKRHNTTTRHVGRGGRRGVIVPRAVIVFVTARPRVPIYQVKCVSGVTDPAQTRRYVDTYYSKQTEVVQFCSFMSYCTALTSRHL